MPTAMTFTSLQDDMRDYLERGDSVDKTVFNQLPRLINLAERELANALKILGFINVVTNTLGVGQSVIPKPDRWRKTASINIGVGTTQIRTFLEPRSYEYLRYFWPDEDLNGQPKFYADYDYFNWVVAPSAEAEYPFEIVYYQLPALLDDSNQTNWTTNYAPNALLHGALLKATSFLGADDRIAVWQGLYERDIAILEQQDLQRVIDRTSTRAAV